MKPVVVMLATLTVLGLGGGLLFTLRDTAPAVSTAGAAASGTVSPGTAAPGTVARESQPAAVSGAPAAPEAAARAARRKRADAVRAQLRQELAGRIRHSTGAPSAAKVALTGSRRPSSTGTSPAAAADESAAPARMPSLEGEGNQAQRPLGTYIQETIRQQFIPLAGGCYEELLQRDPTARGKLVLDLEIVGDGSTGGVVNDVTLGEETTLDDEELATCVSESLYSTVFDAPPGDEKSVTVSYPLELSP